MKEAFARNRVKIAEINGQIEDNLAGIRVVKSFANEDIECEKFKVGRQRKTVTTIWEDIRQDLVHLPH